MPSLTMKITFLGFFVLPKAIALSCPCWPWAFSSRLALLSDANDTFATPNIVAATIEVAIVVLPNLFIKRIIKLPPDI